MPIDSVWKGDVGENEGPYEVGWVGHLWPVWRQHLSKHFVNNIERIRKPISVVLPTRGGGAVVFCIDDAPTRDPDAAWTVTVDMNSLVIGQRPDITVAPSINCVGLYHGYYTNGVITDDLG